MRTGPTLSTTPTLGGVDLQVLDELTWRARAEAHASRVDAFIEPHLARRREGRKHPVHDFLFTYYSQRPAQLRRWHPGYGVALADAPEYDALNGYRGGTVPDGYVAAHSSLIESIRGLLRATADRPAQLGCLGLHEWAMVHRATESTGGTRHAWPLRLGPGGTDQVVESHRISCSHFDAFRFFTPTARPLNTLSPGSRDRAAYEQPGCLHANMDLYKHAFRLTPMIGSDLVTDAFELAWDIRIMDMRAAPYDFTGITLDPTGQPWTPIEIETPKGKGEYVALQRQFSGRAGPIRRRLIAECERLLAVGAVLTTDD
jgi:hypothetical protein